ncbi:hypothetical protein [Mycolicibacterium farcinogenes]|uniref:Uncharacterized protein n=1 Tax=Mycolicibacterium farcinogenes TaxID=1802 RepID=A0ACD1FD85_MYCFR|nr:hypothetical protein [Mycolicibacterium farcinogenes]QZH65023.1 hypothetical protein K6L26_23930 [Mycolicibacterium farcinogenes]
MTVVGVAAVWILWGTAGQDPVPRTQSNFDALSSILATGAGLLAATVIAWTEIGSRRFAGRTTKGLLAVDKTLSILRSCATDSFSAHELRQRRKVNKQIDKLASTIEGIPAALGTRDPEVVREAQERAEGMRALQARVASMDSAEKRTIIEDLQSAKHLYDSGRWMELPAVEVAMPARLSLGYRIGWGLVAFTCFSGIVSVVILTAMAKLPQAAAVSIPFVLALVLYAALGRLGVSGDAMKQAVDVTSKAQGFVGGPAAKKDEAEGPKAEAK